MTKILVIEDERLLRQEVIEWLIFEGYEALGADDGVTGVETAFRFQPDLIVCDVMMPRMDGYSVLLKIHASPLTAFTPFIFLTAKTAYEEIRKGMELGADDYLTKPFKRLDLLQAIDTRLRKSMAQADEHQQQVDLLQQLLADEREQRLLKAKIVGMFSHDFRNSLMGIVISTRMLRHSAQQAEPILQLGHMDRIEASAQQLMQMLDDMLLISQLEAGKLYLRPERLDLGAFFQQIVEGFQAIHSETHRIGYENYPSHFVWADPRLLSHMAVNLIANAIKYSPQGGEVWVLLTIQEAEWSFTVQDWGIGIPETDLDNLFEPFHRAANVGDISGTGLGLSITKETVELHGGTIHVDSQVGVGTTVIVTIPISKTTGNDDEENSGH